ncbi:MAG: Smr/MutS family protein [Proteobacteria bacterium]|nr:Smr/MutS family protein [Pseudomonadota bacterium]
MGDSSHRRDHVAVTDAEVAEFRDAIGPVRRLTDVPEPPKSPRSKPRVAQRTADEQAALQQSRRIDPAALAEALGESVAWRRDDVSPDVLRRLRSGQFAIEDEIDLHGLDERTAEALLRQFLVIALAEGRRCVCIVHGRGWHSPRGPVLKGMVERMLHQRADVLAFASAPAARGGSGAVLALLARKRPR